MKNIKHALFVAVAMALVTVPLAAGAVDPLSNGFNMSKTAEDTKGIVNKPIYLILTTFVNWLLGIVGVLAVIAFVISGIFYLTAAGNEERVEKAKEIMLYAIIGLTVALLGLVIVNAIGGLTGTTSTTAF